MEQEFGVTIHARTEIVQIIGEEETCEQVRQVIQALLVLVNRGMTIGTPDVVTAITMVRNGELISSSLSMKKRLSRTVTASPFVKTLGQKIYVDSVKNHDVTFWDWTSGNWENLPSSDFGRDRPQAWSGQADHFDASCCRSWREPWFPTRDLKEKVDPYLRPVYDALYQILGKDQTTRMMEREIIEIAPWHYMRGRTLDDAFVIPRWSAKYHHHADEDVLTRLGFNSKMIVNEILARLTFLEMSNQA